MSTRSASSGRLNRFVKYLSAVFQRLAAVLIVLFILGVGYWGPHWFFKASEAPLDIQVQAHRDESSEIVELTEEQFQVANIQTRPLASRTQIETMIIAASAKQDETCRLELRAPLAGVIQDVHAGLGKTVQEGAKLCSITADEMGRARGDVARGQAELELATSKTTWSGQVLDGVRELAARIRMPQGESHSPQSPTADQTKLGQFGERLIKAQSAFQLAQANQSSATDLQGLVSGRELRERQAALDQATAALKGELEQIVFEAEQSHQHDLADLQDVRNRLTVAQDRLAALLGPAGASDDGNSSCLILRAPFGGRIEQSRLVPAVRVEENETLLVLADPSRLWIVAEVPENELSKLNLDPGSDVQVRSPAIDGWSSAGNILFVGAAVNPSTRTLPVTIKFSEFNSALRPGMFVWAEFSLREPRQGLLLPNSAVCRQDQSAFVFTEIGPRKYRKIPIQIVHEYGDFVEIASIEIAAGSLIVERGVFVLKSELLLEADE